MNPFFTRNSTEWVRRSIFTLEIEKVAIEIRIMLAAIQHYLHFLLPPTFAYDSFFGY